MSTEIDKSQELVWAEVIGDRPVDRVYKGGTLQMSRANAEMFEKAELVKITGVVEAEEPDSALPEDPTPALSEDPAPVLPEAPAPVLSEAPAPEPVEATATKKSRTVSGAKPPETKGL